MYLIMDFMHAYTHLLLILYFLYIHFVFEQTCTYIFLQIILFNDLYILRIKL